MARQNKIKKITELAIGFIEIIHMKRRLKKQR